MISGDVKYTTEPQYNLKNNYNWVNLLDLNVQLSTEAIGVWRNGFLNMELISIYRTAKERILDDRQVFSNIDEANQPLRIFILGYTHVIGKMNLFFGLRLGIFMNSAKFDTEKEISLELTWKHQIINNLELQPAFHLIENAGNVKIAWILRFSYTLNYHN